MNPNSCINVGHVPSLALADLERDLEPPSKRRDRAWAAPLPKAHEGSSVDDDVLAALARLHDGDDNL